jgi:hypothetical protein
LNFLQRNVNLSNAAHILSFAELHSFDSLIDSCLHIMGVNLMEFTKTDDFLKLSEEGLLGLLKQDDRQADQAAEYRLLHVIWRWANIKAGIDPPPPLSLLSPLPSFDTDPIYKLPHSLSATVFPFSSLESAAPYPSSAFSASSSSSFSSSNSTAEESGGLIAPPFGAVFSFEPPPQTNAPTSTELEGKLRPTTQQHEQNEQPKDEKGQVSKEDEKGLHAAEHDHKRREGDESYIVPKPRGIADKGKEKENDNGETETPETKSENLKTEADKIEKRNEYLERLLPFVRLENLDHLQLDSLEKDEQFMSVPGMPFLLLRTWKIKAGMYVGTGLLERETKRRRTNQKEGAFVVTGRAPYAPSRPERIPASAPTSAFSTKLGRGPARQLSTSPPGSRSPSPLGSPNSLPPSFLSSGPMPFSSFPSTSTSSSFTGGFTIGTAPPVPAGRRRILRAKRRVQR